MDYTWKQNRLSKDKEALKNSVMNVIRKKPAPKGEDSMVPQLQKQGISGGHTPMIQQTSGIGNGASPGVGEQGYSAVKR